MIFLVRVDSYTRKPSGAVAIGQLVEEGEDGGHDVLLGGRGSGAAGGPAAPDRGQGVGGGGRMEDTGNWILGR